MPKVIDSAICLRHFIIDKFSLSYATLTQLTPDDQSMVQVYDNKSSLSRLRRFASILSASLLSVFVIGCQSFRGVGEFAGYRVAFQESRTASEAILDRLAVAERAIWPMCMNWTEVIASDKVECAQFARGRTRFAVAHAPYLADAGDPPATAAFRRAMAANLAYTEALSGLASGATGWAVAAQVGEIVGIASEAAAVVAPISAAGAKAADLANTIALTNDNVTALQEPLSGLFGFVTRAEFRDRLIETAPTMREALQGVRDATPAMFQTFLVQTYVGQPTGQKPSAAEIDRLEATRLLLANWVILLDSADAALAVATEAARGGSIGSAGIIRSSRVMTQAARDVRRALAGSEG